VEGGPFTKNGKSAKGWKTLIVVIFKSLLLRKRARENRTSLLREMSTIVKRQAIDTPPNGVTRSACSVFPDSVQTALRYYFEYRNQGFKGI